MKFIKKIVVLVSFVTVFMYAKQMKRSFVQPRVPATSTPSVPAPQPTPQPKDEWVAPDISTLPAPLNQTPEAYASNKVAAVSQQLVRDIFPRTDSIERIVFQFRDEYPVSFKETDITILYNAIINDPEVKKNLMVKNATPVYNFIKETLSKAWDKKGE